jgi:drug/metabolite transporter (DMT)-like permease
MLILAVAAAVLFGSSDFCAARSARNVSSVTVARTANLVSLLLAPAVLLLDPGTWTLRDSLIGSAAGFFMMLGLLQLYRGYSVARMGIVAPSSSVLTAAVPVAIDLVRGIRPDTLPSIGIAVGLTALALTGYQPGTRGSVRQGLLLGVGSGLAFGAAFTVMGEVAPEAGLTPIVTQRATGLALLAVLALFMTGGRASLVANGRSRTPFLCPPGPTLKWAIAAGTLGIGALGSLQLALRDGDSGVVSVAASQFGTAAVILSVIFNGERMRWWQALGVAATAFGVALLSLG